MKVVLNSPVTYNPSQTGKGLAITFVKIFNSAFNIVKEQKLPITFHCFCSYTANSSHL